MHSLTTLYPATFWHAIPYGMVLVRFDFDEKRTHNQRTNTVSVHLIIYWHNVFCNVCVCVCVCRGENSFHHILGNISIRQVLWINIFHFDANTRYAYHNLYISKKRVLRATLLMMGKCGRFVKMWKTDARVLS